MSKVFTGRVSIPGDKLQEYFELMKAAEEERAPFREHLMTLQADFYEHLAERYSDHTARKHASIVEMFVEFICRYTDVQDVSEITRGMVNSHFRAWWKRKVWDSSTPDDLRVALKKFFTFLASEKGMVNENALKALGAKQTGAEQRGAD
jgi:site-specific recombinase XerD